MGKRTILSGLERLNTLSFLKSYGKTYLKHGIFHLEKYEQQGLCLDCSISK